MSGGDARPWAVYGLAFALVVGAIAGLVWGAVALLDLLHDIRTRNLDLTVVRSDQRSVPFFELLFDTVSVSDRWSLADPHVRRRGKPLLDGFSPPVGGPLGPHDLLGFRNRSIPRRPDIVVLGDSQSYGINAPYELNWPSFLGRISGRVVYNASLPGWTGLSYLYMIEKVLHFDPKIVVVALYVGNDFLENVLLGYSSDYWEHLRPRPELEMEDFALEVRSGGVLRGVRLANGSTMPFQVSNRLDVTDPTSLAVEMGRRMQLSAVEHIARRVRSHSARVAVTIIPTKEYVFAERLRKEGVPLGRDYERLIRVETDHLVALRAAIRESGLAYVDVVDELRARVLRGEDLYPYSGDGHPSTAGYQALAMAVWRGLRGQWESLDEASFWSGGMPLPAVSDAQPMAVAEFLGALRRRGFRETRDNPRGMLGGIRAPSKTPSHPVLRGWAVRTGNRSAQTHVAVVVDGQVVATGRTRGERADVSAMLGAEAPHSALRIPLEGRCESYRGREVSAIAIGLDDLVYAPLPRSTRFDMVCSGGADP